MSARGEEVADRIQDNLVCPQCDYSLRGLNGPVINCPECGLQCDLARMIARRWDGSWTQAPGYSDLLRPVVVFSTAPGGVLLVLVYEFHTLDGDGKLTAMAMLAAATLWAFLLFRTRDRFPHINAIQLSLFAHVLMLGYIGALILAVWSFGWAVSQPGNWISWVISLPIVVSMGAVLVLCRRGERFIALRCIQQYLLRPSPPSTFDTMAA
ncbi:MAG: hypothetical protein L0Y44_10335 [Phycisphaerales bacterium]|nr:hypothetical protein [Phycisphaerales bacterium]MCI0631035.1 hypothetical protein [Phycisphaerales bacterium]MCI0675737.1 hypothetical protein [Phycisphaerales bacterium]